MRDERIRLSHGSGGKLTLELIQEVFVAAFGSAPLRELTDAAVLHLEANPNGKIAFTTDSHAVQPLFFPGGDIGRLAVAGTVNDLAVMGARPRYLSAAFIIEQDFPIADLRKIVESMKATADEAGVEIVAGDTKVVERGKGDGVFINTAGIGLIPPGRELSLEKIRPGDVLLVNGTLGDHGLAILAQREGFAVDLELKSDVAPLNGLVEALLEEVPEVRFMRDLTRGGLAAVANEIVLNKDYGVLIFEERVPVRPDVAEYSELLGVSPLRAANEGKVLIVVPPERAEQALQALKAHPLGREAAIIGKVVKEPAGLAVLETPYGSHRILEMPVEEQYPRIC